MNINEWTRCFKDLKTRGLGVFDHHSDLITNPLNNISIPNNMLFDIAYMYIVTEKNSFHIDIYIYVYHIHRYIENENHHLAQSVILGSVKFDYNSHRCTWITHACIRKNICTYSCIFVIVKNLMNSLFTTQHKRVYECCRMFASQ